MPLDMGRATAGASMATPMKMSDGAEADQRDGRRGQADARRGDPDHGDDAAPVKRRRKETRSSVCWAVTAATGAMRTARRAGLMAEITVTPTPTTTRRRPCAPRTPGAPTAA